MEVIRLTPIQVMQLYPFMEKDFPADELKPLSRILSAMENGTYECLGMRSNGKLIGYAYFVRTGNQYLLDYLAVNDKNKNRGIGSQFLRMLVPHLSSADSIIGEVEDPAFAADKDEYLLQTRRLQFYMRNGFRPTGVQVYVFGVHYLLIEMEHGKAHTDQEIRELYRQHYLAMLPEEMYRENVRI